MKKLHVLLATALVGVGVAITYHIFENLVHGAINLVWYDWLDTDSSRWLVLPLCVVLSFVFFGLVHHFDPGSEGKDEKGLGSVPDATIVNLVKILGIGFFSLFAGASLGPEAVLVPASMVLGVYTGTKLFPKNKQISKLLAAAAIIALFTAFFNSIIVGVLSIFLVLKQAKTKLSGGLLLVSVVASVSAFYALKAISSEPYATFPSYGWELSIQTLGWCLALAIAGYLAIMLMSRFHDRGMSLISGLNKQDWKVKALVAAVGLTVLYLLGGPLVEFTGNKSIVPLFEQAAGLGLGGLLWILLIKVCVIGWSKAVGYRGGMIFPTIFLAAVLVAIVQLYVPDFNLIYGIIAPLVGAFIANKNTEILV